MHHPFFPFLNHLEEEMPLAWRWNTAFEPLDPVSKPRAKRKTTNTKLYNRGDIAEGVVGVAWAVALTTHGSVTVEDLDSLICQTTMSRPLTSRTQCCSLVVKTSEIEVNLNVALSKDNMTAFLQGSSHPGMKTYYNAIVAYANSKQIKRAKEWLLEKDGPTKVTIKAGGSHFPKTIKTDILVETTDEQISLPFGNITLKCDTKQISMVSRNFNASSPTSNSRGISDLIETLTGFKPSQNLQTVYDDAVWNKRDHESLLQAVEAVYSDVATQAHLGVLSGLRTPSESLAVFAKGLRSEAVGVLSRPVQIRLNDKDSTFTYLDYGTLESLVKLIETAVPEAKIDFKITYQPGNRQTGSQPYLYFSVGFGGIDYGRIASIRPKIRHHRNSTQIKEFKHYFQNEPGLEKLLMDVAIVNKSVGYTILPDVVTYFRK